MRLRGKEKSNEINIDVDMKRTCHTYQTLIHHDFKKGEMILSILVDTFISKISLPMQPVPEIGSISVA